MFKRFRLALVLPVFLAPSAFAADANLAEDDPLFVGAEDVELDTYLWVKRPVVVLADSENDPRFVQQIALLEGLQDELRTRDVVVLTDTNPEAKSALRQKLRPRGFMLVVMAKDGTVYLRKPFPWDVREISRSIDKLPLRQQEVRDRRAAK